MARQWTVPRKILCATDLSAAGDRAVDRALHLAQEWSSNLAVLHVVNQTGDSRKIAEHVGKCEIKLKEQVRRHPLATGLYVDVIVTRGEPAERILGKCDRMLVDFLVVGPGERRSIGQRLLGSTVDRILRSSLQPVLSVRARPQGPYRNVGVATDLSVPSGEALNCALALFPEANSIVVHAYDDSLHGLFEFDQMTGPLAERHKQEIRLTVERSMNDFLQAPRTIHKGLAMAVAAGKPEPVLKGMAEELAWDLLVLGTHGRTGVRRALIGSVAERLIGSAECDTLAVRAAE